MNESNKKNINTIIDTLILALGIGSRHQLFDLAGIAPGSRNRWYKRFDGSIPLTIQHITQFIAGIENNIAIETSYNQDNYQSLLRKYQFQLFDAIGFDIDILSQSSHNNIEQTHLSHENLLKNSNINIKISICQAICMTFIDIVRIICVCSSDRARMVNRERYDEFIQVLHQHKNDLHEIIVQFNHILECRDNELAIKINRRFSLLTRWINSINNCRINNIRENIDILKELSMIILEYCKNIAPDYVNKEIYWFEEIKIKYFNSGMNGVFIKSMDIFNNSRMELQNIAIYSHNIENENIYTIRDDIDHYITIKYFIIDNFLLSIMSI